jgi:hypothetical protein
MAEKQFAGVAQLLDGIEQTVSNVVPIRSHRSAELTQDELKLMEVCGQVHKALLLCQAIGWAPNHSAMKLQELREVLGRL